MYRQILFVGVVILLAPILCVAGGGGHLDYSQLPYTESILKIVEQNTPPAFEEYYQEWSEPDMLWMRVCAMYYQKDGLNNDSSLLLVFYGHIKHAVLKVISMNRDIDYGKIVAETNLVFGETLVRIELYDIDCDGINEVLLYSISGMAAIQTLCIVKITGGEIRILSGAPESVGFDGRIIEIDKTGKECPRPIKVYVDGPVKYQPDTVKTYRFDSAKQSYRLESVQAIQQQKK